MTLRTDLVQYVLDHSAESQWMRRADIYEAFEDAKPHEVIRKSLQHIKEPWCQRNELYVRIIDRRAAAEWILDELAYAEYWTPAKDE